MTVRPYTPADKAEWDDCVGRSRNGTFLHLRDYMDYHADRFADSSLLARDDKGRLIAVLPAHIAGQSLCSHRGLSYGGWLMTARADAPAMLDIWRQTCDYAREAGCSEIVYRPVPHIYHRYPAEEDLYALFRSGACLDSTLLSSVVDCRCPLAFDMSCRQSVRKAAAAGVTVAESIDYASFWDMLSALLDSRYGATPVHTLTEIELLRSRFPDNIRLYTATCDGVPVAGVVIYITDTVVHSQYTATTADGRRLRALPLLYRSIMDHYADKHYFDFGTSNERGGLVLNEGLVRQKIGFGARAIAYQTYRVDLS